jgi:hypothetical protein
LFCDRRSVLRHMFLKSCGIKISLDIFKLTSKNYYDHESHSNLMEPSQIALVTIIEAQWLLFLSKYLECCLIVMRKGSTSLRHADYFQI